MAADLFRNTRKDKLALLDEDLFKKGNMIYVIKIYAILVVNKDVKQALDGIVLS